MTKVRIEPGICGFTAIAEAEAAEELSAPEDALPAEEAEELEPLLLPQATRPMVIVRAKAKARNFFMVKSPF